MSPTSRSLAEPSNAPLAAWTAMLDVLPIPAALIDADGVVISNNGWVEERPGDALVKPAGKVVGPGPAFGADSTSRWSIMALDEAATVFLATAEREHAGDHLLQLFFSRDDTLFVVYDRAGRIIQSNAAWENLLGYTHDEVFGLDSWTLLPPDDHQTKEMIETELLEHGRCEPVFKVRTADGSYRLIHWAMHLDVTAGRCFGIGRDLTEDRRQTNEQPRRADIDELTGLANRASLLEELGSLIAGSNTPAVLFCDLDHFKVINDSLGHQTGDRLLAGLARRLESLIGGDQYRVARLGGDEFVILIPDAERAGAVAAAKRVLAGMREPFEIDGRPVHGSMSIGIAVVPEPGTRTADGLLSEADTAAYQAKSLGRSRFVVFDEELRATADRRFNVEEGLHLAIETGGIEVQYQPIVSLPGGGVVGVEALVRWRTEEGELIAPVDFLDVAEEAGLMPRIGEIVLRAAATLGADFARAGRELMVSVNVSPQDLADTGYVRRVLRILEETGIAPEKLLLEITESAVLNTESSLPLLRTLRAAGLRIGLDDFGTGFSSLSHLRELPIDVVKVDRSFVTDLVDDRVTRAVTESLVNLCGALGLSVVLEGIETKEHAAAVEQIGGTMAQGFLFHRPMPPEELSRLLGLTEKLADQADQAEERISGSDR